MALILFDHKHHKCTHIIHTAPILSKCSCLLKSMAFPLKNHLKFGFRDESLDTSQGNTRLCPTVASKLMGGTIILVSSEVLKENHLLLYGALYKIQQYDGDKA